MIIAPLGEIYLKGLVGASPPPLLKIIRLNEVKSCTLITFGYHKMDLFKILKGKIIINQIYYFAIFN
jgi:hypothetical protein